MPLPEPTLYKLPPQNIEAEQMILGAVLVDPEAISRVIDLLRPDDFYRAAHSRIWAEMTALAEKREPIDLITLHEALRGSGAIEAVGGASYLAQLVSLAPSAANIKPHAEIVRQKSLLRKALNVCGQIEMRIHDDTKPVVAEDVLDFAETSIMSIGMSLSVGGLVPIKNTVGAAFGIIEQRYENKQSITGVPTGFVDLDDKTAGFQPADLILVAARPSMGKTALALNIAAHAGMNKKLRVAFFSLEMSRESLIHRLMSSEARVDAHSIRTGRLQERDWVPLSHASGRIAESGIHIDDTAALSVMEVRARSRRMKAEHGLDLVIVDYLQLMRGRGDEGNREQEISGISRGLKALAKELHVPVVALSQLNRAVETRVKDKRPMLADLRESGALEQDADVILFIYREEVYDKCTCAEDRDCLCGRRGLAEVIIGKQRNGPTGKVDLTYLNKWTRFENKAREIKYD